MKSITTATTDHNAEADRVMHLIAAGFSIGLPDGGSTPVRPLISCGGKGCRGGAA